MDVIPAIASNESLTPFLFIVLNPVMLHNHFLHPAIRPANRLQYALFNSAPHVMIATDNQGTIQAFNAAAEKLLGYSAEEVIGRLTPVVFHDSTELWQDSNYQQGREYHLIQPGVEVLVSKARQGMVHEQEWTYRCKNGDRILVWLSVAPIQDENNMLLGFLFSAQDITAQRRAEIATKKTELHFRQMVGNVPGMIYQHICHKDGTDYFPFVGCNCFSIFEVEPTDIQKNANTLWEMVDPDDLRAFRRNSALAAQLLQTYETELRIVTPTGCVKWIQSIAHPTMQPNGDIIWDGVMIDISNRRKLEQERDRFFNLPLDILAVLHLNGVFRQVNTAVMDILGYSIQEFQSQPLPELVHPDDQEATRKALERLSQGSTAFFENRCRCHDGSYKWLSWKAIPVPEENLVYAIGRDVTVNKTAEMASRQLNHELENRVQERTVELQKAHQELSFLIENFQLAAIEWDADFRVQRWSPEAEKLFGWGADNIVGKAPYDWKFIYEADQAIANETIQALLHGTASRGMYSIRNYTADQSIVYCDWFHSALVDETGKLVSVLSLVLNITERKQAEEDLKASQHRFSTAFNRSPAALSITTFPEGIQLDVNESWVLSTGYSREEAIGRQSSDLRFWEFPLEQQQFIQTLSEQGSVRNLLMHSRIKSGEIRKILLSSDLIELDGRSCLLNSAIDITEQKHAEDKVLQALERERELGELKTQFITNTSHEFRTPLTTILGSAELLDSVRQNLTEEKKRKHCDRIRFAVKHMTQLLDDVLIVSKAEAGKLPFDPIRIELTAFCRNLVEDLKSGIGKDCTIHFSSQTEPIMGEFDEKLLRQVLENLISNAVKYSPQGQPVYFELRETQETAEFRVQDKGIGIPDAEIPHLFEPFQRASNVGGISGTGLGLSIVKKAVELHQGIITVNSHVGQGSLFTVIMPRCTQSGDRKDS
ncbi:PAS domain S-box protein [Leptolyngbya sp. AN02str]|uniref:PAS domain S-box protein n=1 Tax=Leptolyngbya sp. AN02str TaxID=3423363 RepID=UPI003D319A38